MTETIILASRSPFRRAMLEDAGLTIEAQPAETDERSVEAALDGAGLTPDEVALVLAEAKASDVASRNPGRLVLGCDQTLSLDEAILHKPTDMEGARRRLLALSGKEHRLNSAAVLVRDGAVLWRHVALARLRMRPLDPAFIGRHLSRVGKKALQSVGAYQIEGEGIQLFDAIEGDHFTIIGLPLLPLLAELRRLKAIDA